jgi:hypothetical protein
MFPLAGGKYLPSTPQLSLMKPTKGAVFADDRIRTKDIEDSADT